MVKPNWKVFQAKFSENPQHNFEWFCYLLFCKEYNMEYGIFRYKNQSAIETNPITINADVVAWQAKFYETPLSNHRNDLLDTLNKLNENYPEVNKLYLYSNQEWGQNKVGDMPQGLKDIEKLAKKLDICLEWKLASFFESEFVIIKNDIIAKHFFAFEKSLVSALEEMQKHSKNLLKQINTNISFNEKKFEIKRDNEMDKLISDSNQVCIISGAGGVGKTVLVKNMYERFEGNDTFYIFKATEFELKNINDIFGDYNLYDFLSIHKNIEHKTIVVDSAEKLLDLQNTDPFKEFLSAIVEDEWKVIFTTRDNYLKDLNYQFFEIYQIVPLNIGIRSLEKDELDTISNENGFTLPKDEKLLELIRNPFYLNEYLKFYKDIDEIDYVEFKSKLWEQRIKKSKPEREKCFLEIASKRANTGQFFVDVKIELGNYCDELMKDGMLGYEEVGYFITHDIYEEWALEKIINREFSNRSDEHGFFVSIGQSLSMRRCLRNWISEKLLLEDREIVEFIENTIKNNQIEDFWKDEVFAAVLLSDYSRSFFKLFKNQLLSNQGELLKRLTFILRIACKEIDDDFFTQIGLKKIDLYTLKYIMTKPKGFGWETLIEFVYNNINEIGIENINFVLPLIHDWSNKIKSGFTTRYAGLIALNFYHAIIQKTNYYSQDTGILESILKTIINSSYELKNELKDIITKILNNKWKNHSDPYYKLVKFILTEIEGLPICRVLPKQVLELADLFWTFTPSKNHVYSDWCDNVEHDFGIEKGNGDYSPASAYQSPIYVLLKIAPKETMNFIVRFTNRSVNHYALLYLASRLDEITEVEVIINEKNPKKQYINRCLWEIYRGTSSPVSPNLLQSIHMALEKFLLEIAKKLEAKALVGLLNYLLKSAESASISSVVTSVVLAYPEKTFDTAKILFRTKEFIIHDIHRLASEQHAKTLYSMGKNFGFRKNNIYDEERLQTCEDKHRKWSLEGLFLQYQVFSMQNSEEEAKNRQKVLWEILDDYYSELPLASEQGETDKVWSLFLARMDKRKMKINAEKTNEGVLIQFEPEIEPEIDAFRAENQKTYEGHMRYVPLKLWADFKFKNDNKSKEYEQYDSNPQNALNEVEKILEKLNGISNPEFTNTAQDEDETFYLFNYAIPSCVCSVLIKYYIDQLSNEDKLFCKDVIIDRVQSCVQPNYSYQLGDGVQEAISVLPKLMTLFPEEKDIIKLLLLLILFKDEHVGGILSSERFNVFSMIAIQILWEISFDDAHSLFLGYLIFKPQYDELENEIRKEYFEKIKQKSDFKALSNRFLTINKKPLKKMINNELSISDLANVEELDLYILANAINLLPSKLDHKDHIAIAYKIIPVFARELTQSRNGDRIDYMVRNGFLRKYAYLVLYSNSSDVPQLIQPFIDKFNSSEVFAELFQNFIYAEDELQSYDNFWLVWNQFKGKIIEATVNGTNTWYVDKLIKSYLFAQMPWKDTAKEWHSLKLINMRLIRDVSEQMGPQPSVLYSISKLLNDIGSPFIDEGLIWISNMLSRHSEYKKVELEINTSYYLENLVRKYVYEEREKIKKNKQIKQKILVVLNFLIEKGSTVGYILRENII